jgi:signal transduction histidine kinase/tetratricopeptide (TPR) repeat protein
VRDGETLQATLSEAMRDWFGADVASRISKGVSSRTSIVMTPLERGGRATGVLAVSVPGPSKQLLRSVQRLARHTSAALELAHEHKDRKNVEEELRSSHEQLRSLSGHLQSAREEERTHIAREMHDELGQTLTALKIELSTLKADLPKAKKGLLKGIDSSLALTDRSIQTVKRISGELRPRLLDTLGLVAAMRRQGKEFEKRTGIVCSVTTEPEEIAVDRELSTAIFRVFQEALTNVARHSGATRVEASLRERGNQLELVVRDNGKGITKDRVEQSSSFGLVGMRERVRYWGGEFAIEGGRKKGTTVKVIIPIEDSAERRMVSTSRLVGREKELRKLRSALTARGKGDGKLILIRGEAGVGKSRLLTEFGQDLETRGGRVLLGRCREDTRSVAYYSFREALSRFLEVRREEGVSVYEGLPDYSRWELGRIVPAFKSEEPAGFEPAKDPFRLYEAFRLFVQDLAARSDGPLLFAVEDLHLSDDASLDLLKYLARNRDWSGVQLCATYRTEEAGESLQEFTRSLRKEELSQAINLKPLTSESVSEMIDLFYPGREASSQFRGLLYEKTQGNPFFVSELVKLVPGEDVTADVTDISDIPESIQGVLQKRVEVLDSGSREILSCAALVGEEFDFEVLRGAVGRSEMEVMEAIEVGARAHIVRESTRGEEERYRFVHALMADTLYSGIGKTRRRLWHSQVGEALERVYAERLEELNGQLTHHFELGHNWEKAFAHAIRSAEQAKKTYANQEAIKLYKKARQILPRLARSPSEKEEVKIEIGEGLGDVYQVTGEWEQASREYGSAKALARKRGDDRREGEVLCKMSWICCSQGNFDKAMDYAESSRRIHQRTGNKGGRAAALNAIGNAHEGRGEYEDALESHEEALKIWKKIRDRQGAATTLNNIGKVHYDRGDYEEALKCFAESLAARKAIGDKRGQAESLKSIGTVHMMRGNYEPALAVYGQSLSILREIGDRMRIGHSLHNIGNIRYFQGNHEEALRCFEESLAIFRDIGDKFDAARSLNNIGAINWDRRDCGEALKRYGESLAIRRKIGDKRGMATSLSNIGMVQEFLGGYEEAMKCCEESLKIRREIGDKMGEAWCLSDMGLRHQHLGAFGEAIKCHKESLALMKEMGSKDGEAQMLHYIGTDYHRLGDQEKALRYLNRALRMVEELEYKLIEPDILGALSFAWLKKGNSQKATEFCERSMEAAESQGHTEDLAKGRIMKAEILLWESEALNDGTHPLRGGTHDERLRAELVKDAEDEVKKAQRVAEQLDALPLLAQTHELLGRLYQEMGKKERALDQFSKANAITEKIASRMEDENLRESYLSSEPVQSKSEENPESP